MLHLTEEQFAKLIKIASQTGVRYQTTESQQKLVDYLTLNARDTSIHNQIAKGMMSKSSY